MKMSRSDKRIWLAQVQRVAAIVRKVTGCGEEEAFNIAREAVVR
jgi:hypothetical protein